MPKHIAVNARQSMLQEIQQRGIHQSTIEQYLGCVRDHNQEIQLYGDWDAEDVALAFLWYLVIGPSYRKVEQKTRIPKSDLKQHFGTIRRIISPWAALKVVPGSAFDRRSLANRLIDDVGFKDISGILDVSDFRAVPLDVDEEEKQKCMDWKFKFKGGYKYLFHMLPNEKFAFVGGNSGGRRHDLKLLVRDSLLWKRSINAMPGEKFLVDTGFQSAQNKPTLSDLVFHQPHKRTGGRDLTPEQIEWNYRVSRIRSSIERAFGVLKARFRILSRPFYGPPHRHEEIVKICVGIYNEEKERQIRASQQLNINNLLH